MHPGGLKGGSPPPSKTADTKCKYCDAVMRKDNMPRYEPTRHPEKHQQEFEENRAKFLQIFKSPAPGKTSKVRLFQYEYEMI